MPITPLKRLDTKYGAPHGRPSAYLATGGRIKYHEPIKFYLEVMRLDSGGYDSGGAYWGLRPKGMRLYRFENQKIGAWGFIDATDRTAAKEQIRRHYTKATFHR